MGVGAVVQRDEEQWDDADRPEGSAASTGGGAISTDGEGPPGGAAFPKLTLSRVPSNSPPVDRPPCEHAGGGASA